MKAVALSKGQALVQRSFAAIEMRSFRCAIELIDSRPRAVLTSVACPENGRAGSKRYARRGNG